LSQAVIKIIATIASVIGLYEGIKYLNKKKIFISFAVEDKGIRDLLVGQAINKSSPFEFIDMSVKTPWDNGWKNKCRERIQSCNGVIVLVTKNTNQAEGARWEIKCAHEEKIPVMAIYASNSHKNCRLPAELKGKRIHNWSWNNIKKFVNNLD
jgi:hypothetical protein